MRLQCPGVHLFVAMCGGEERGESRGDKEREDQWDTEHNETVRKREGGRGRSAERYRDDGEREDGGLLQNK